MSLEHPVAAAGAATAGAAEDEGVVHLEVAGHLSEDTAGARRVA